MWIDCINRRAPGTLFGSHEHITMWRGKSLPSLPHNTLAALYERIIDDVHYVEVRVYTGRSCEVLREPRSEFPSDTLLAQVLLLA